MYWFSPPTQPENRTPMPPRGGGIARLFARLRTEQGLTLIRRDGIFRLLRHPDPQTDYVDAERVYVGGHRYLVNPQEAQDLTDAGYGEWLTGPLSTYGSGPYGDGPFGGS